MNRDNDAMGNPWARRGLIITLLAVLAIVVIAASACSGSQADTDTSSSPEVVTETTDPAATTTASGPTRLVVGGKTADEYAAEIPKLEKELETDPENLTILQDLAVAQYNSGRLDEAASTYQRMLQIKDDPTVHNNYGNVLRDQKKLTEAETQYRAAMEGDPSLVAPYINLARLLMARQDLDGALKMLDQGIAHTVGEDKQRLQDYRTTLSQSK